MCLTVARNQISVRPSVRPCVQMCVCVSCFYCPGLQPNHSYILNKPIRHWWVRIIKSKRGRDRGSNSQFHNCEIVLFFLASSSSRQTKTWINNKNRSVSVSARLFLFPSSSCLLVVIRLSIHFFFVAWQFVEICVESCGCMQNVVRLTFSLRKLQITSKVCKYKWNKLKWHSDLDGIILLTLSLPHYRCPSCIYYTSNTIP